MQTGLLTVLGMVTVLPAKSVTVRVPLVSGVEVSGTVEEAVGAFTPQEERSTAEQRARTRSEINNFFILLNLSMFFYFRELCCFFGRTTALPFINFNSASKPYNCDNRLSFSISAPP